VRVLDLFCCQGGAGKGYADAGFEVVGVDVSPQKRYPFTFVQADAIAYLLEHGHEFDFIHASPPCQFDSVTAQLNDSEHPDLIEPTIEALETVGVPWVVENVGGALPKLANAVMLCGAPFGLHTYRHRYFKTGGWTLPQPEHPKHEHKNVKMGRALKTGDWYHAVGNFSGVEYARQDMRVPWMNRDGVRECIPPVYAEYVGLAFLAQR
jgi:DNA (cytosine-5)-methyltransferase 1